ncbi:KTSC domain-containing protein [Kitasatospora sp. NPDC048540]|uniref:KTSC domain-containing protein n=1 Tax=unclassified Kitasatospora TaxID=2633591 RepID=UPI000539B8DF|nr:KTSC domain-containing protein [Kitasatospora sp. MBT63]
MERVPLESSWISSAGYDAAVRELEVETLAGAVYRYLAVPPEEYAALLAAESHGRYLNLRIKPRYGYRRVSPCP